MTFARKPYVRPARAPVVPVVGCRGVYARADDTVRAVVPKGIKAKPGKRKPTADEKRWMDAIVSYGCIACRIDGHEPRDTLPHHILRGGRRIGHLFTIPLCDPGHHQNGGAFGLVSRHPFKTRFEAKYGAELQLLAKLKVELGVFDAAEYTV